MSLIGEKWSCSSLWIIIYNPGFHIFCQFVTKNLKKVYEYLNLKVSFSVRQLIIFFIDFTCLSETYPFAPSKSWLQQKMLLPDINATLCSGDNCSRCRPHMAVRS